MIWSRGFVLLISVLLFLTAFSPMVYGGVSTAAGATVNSVSKIVCKKLFTRSFYERCRCGLGKRFQGFFRGFGGNHGFSGSTVGGEVEQWDIVVPDDYSTIQSAVDAAGPTNGYRIFVRNGVYYENVVIDKDGVVLHGESVEGTVIDGSGKGCVVYISSSFNNVSGFTVRNGGVGSAGVKLDVSSGNLICCNRVVDNGGDGFLLYRSHANVIEGNWVVENGGCGFLLNFSCLGNIIGGNVISGNGVDGVLITGVCRSNLVAGNKLKDNAVGIKITEGSKGNMVHHNCFVDNNLNAYDDSNNSWDDGVCEGNYWDDYTGVDSDGDGIGDTPYNVPGGDSVDRFPLMNPPLMQTFSFSEQPAITHKIYGRNPLGSSLGEVIVVPDDYPSIQEAVDHACDGDTILVKPGVYFENVVVNKTLSIVGDDAESTVVDGGGVGHVFTVVADGCNLSVFTIRNTSMGFAGVKVKSNQVVVRGNIIRDVGDGVNLAVSDGSVVEDNVISGCNFGVYSDSFTNGWVVDNRFESNNDGVAMWMSTDIVVKGNTVEDNGYDGVLHLWSGDNKLDTNNIVGNGDFGIEMFSSYGNVVEGNSVRNTVEWGLSLHRSSGNSIGNNTFTGKRGGVSLWFYSSNNTVSDNVIANTSGEIELDGIQFDNSCDNVVSGNTIKDIAVSGLSGSVSGILFVGSDNNTVSGNTISGLTGPISCGIYFIISVNNAVSGNTIKDIAVSGLSGSVSGIVLLVSDNNTVSGNTIKDIAVSGLSGSVSGIVLLVSDNNTVSGNTIKDIAVSGLSGSVSGITCGGFDNIVSGNTITASAGSKGTVSGIAAVVSINNTILGNTITASAGSKGTVIGIFLLTPIDNMVSGNTITASAGSKGTVSGITCGGFDNTVSGNTIKDIAVSGLSGSVSGITCGGFDNTVSGNTIKDIAVSGLSGSVSGIVLLVSDNNTVSGNTIKDIAVSGLSGTVSGILFVGSDNNTVSGNTISGLTGPISCGIYFIISVNNTVSGNTITDTRGLLAFGIFLILSDDNLIFHNNLKENRFNAFEVVGSNTWDNGYPSGGNYWDDYTGRDADGDGIGDTPYRILGGNVDRYPLMKPWSGG